MTFYEEWQSATVRVRSGPLANWVGIIGATYAPRVEVVFPIERGLERVWMLAEDLEILREVTA